MIRFVITRVSARRVKVLVTGAHGKVGRALVPRLMEAGHEVRTCDLTRPVWDRADPGEAEDYWQVDLTDAGAAYAVAAGMDVVVHTAAIPQPIHNAPHVVFANNMLSTFNVLEAAIAGGARRLVNFSSETVPGFLYALRPFEPEYLPIDEEHPSRPQDAYATSKWFGELLCERAVERSDIRCTSIRPSWVQDEGSYERNLGPIVRDPSVLIGNYLGYVDVHDLVRGRRARDRDGPARARALLHRIARHDRRSPPRRDGERALQRRRHRVPAHDARGRIARLDVEGRAAARLDADAHLAGLSRRAGSVARVRTRRLGRDGPALSVIGFGAWGIGGPWRFGWGPVDDDESIAAIRRAVELGVNWVDTAAVYGLGHSEEVVGRALRPYPVGDDVLVFTKCGRRWEGRPEGEIGNDLRPESIREECERSLRRLGLERIDLYQCHWPDWTTGTLLEESWGTMAALVDEGKVRWIGACNFDVEQLDRCEAVRHVDSVQPPLSLLARGVLSTVVPWAAEHGAGVLGYSPLASGLLSGAYDRDRIAGLAEDDARRQAPPFREPLLSQNLELVERLRQLAAGLGTTLPALAIAWVLAQPGVTASIVGARLPGHVDGWAAAAELAPDDRTLREIGDAVAATGAGSDVPPAPPPHIRPVHDRTGAKEPA